MTLQVLYESVRAALESCAPSAGGDSGHTFADVMRSPAVRACIDWTSPRVDDVTEMTGASRGRVLATRLDEYANGLGHKIPVVGALLVRHALRSIDSRACPEGLIDGGNVSTGLALGYFAEKFDLQAKLVLSRFFPDDILRFIESKTNGRVKTIVAPRRKLGREREFYQHLVDIVRKSARKEGFACLWHAKYGGRVLQPLGETLASHMAAAPDVIVLSIGAGATLEGWAIPIQDRFGGRPRIVAVEHASCPLIELRSRARSSIRLSLPSHLSTAWLRPPPLGIPHSVMGPHYDELNPLIRRDVLDRVDGIVRYSEQQWKAMASYCRFRGISVGNSSAVNLLVARSLADAGKSVLTFIYEPCRPYYEASHSDYEESCSLTDERPITVPCDTREEELETLAVYGKF